MFRVMCVYFYNNYAYRAEKLLPKRQAELKNIDFSMCSKNRIPHQSLIKLLNSHPLYTSLAESALTHEHKIGRKAG